MIIYLNIGRRPVLSSHVRVGRMLAKDSICPGCSRLMGLTQLLSIQLLAVNLRAFPRSCWDKRYMKVINY